MEYAIVYNNAIRETRSYDRVLEPSEIRHIDGIPVARPLNFLPLPPFDELREKLQRNYTIFDDRVDVSYTVVSLDNEEKKGRIRDKILDLASQHYMELLFITAWAVRAQLPANVVTKLEQLKALRDELLAL